MNGSGVRRLGSREGLVAGSRYCVGLVWVEIHWCTSKDKLRSVRPVRSSSRAPATAPRTPDRLPQSTSSCRPPLLLEKLVASHPLDLVRPVEEIHEIEDPHGARTRPSFRAQEVAQFVPGLPDAKDVAGHVTIDLS